MALIDRNFQGFAKEIFTDAGKYVIHFGESSQQAAENVANTVQVQAQLADKLATFACPTLSRMHMLLSRCMRFCSDICTKSGSCL